MRSDALKRHMKIHENKAPQKASTKTREDEEYHSTLDVAALENIAVENSNEFKRKLEIGRELKAIIVKRKIMKASLQKDHAEALELFENHGQVKKITPVEWRPWQRELLVYANNPTPRRIIWVVGKKGNEGKSFFQNQIEEQYGLHRVCTMSLTESSRNLLHYMRGCVDIATDIFLFNIPKSVDMENVNYSLLENIKDGKAMTGKYTTKKLYFTTPNVVMVFSNDYPDTTDFSDDRWMIFKINKELELEEVTVAQLKKKRRGGCTNKYRYNGYNQWNSNKLYYDSE